MSERVDLDVASLSHPGMVRSHNEDSVFVDAGAGIGQTGFELVGEGEEFFDVVDYLGLLRQARKQYM